MVRAAFLVVLSACVAGCRADAPRANDGGGDGPSAGDDLLVAGDPGTILGDQGPDGDSMTPGDSAPTADDLDADGILDTLDNCPTLANPSQSDDDADGLGDACDDAGRRQVPTSARCLSAEPSFVAPEARWSWPGSQTLAVSGKRRVTTPPMVADLDRDGDIEVVFVAYSGGPNDLLEQGALVIAAAATGQTLTMVMPDLDELSATGSLALGDLDGAADGNLEIVGLRFRSPGGPVVFNHDGTVAWSCRQSDNCLDYRHSGMSFSATSLADLDGDGVSEIVFGHAVYRRNGAGGYDLHWQGTGGAGDNGLGALSVVADLDGDLVPEILAGRTVYRADGSIAWDGGAPSDGLPGVGDLDGDGAPEVVLVADGTVRVLDGAGALCWGPLILPTGSGLPNMRGGPPAVVDVDGDGRAEVAVAGHGALSLFDDDGALVWSVTVDDPNSAVTGVSGFDFDADGWSELLFNDQTTLRIFSGASGAELWAVDNSTKTASEYPVIADVDGDGGPAELLVATNPSGVGTAAGVTVYGAAAWSASRPLWNQYAYHITNVADDGTIPATMQPFWLDGSFEGWPLGAGLRANSAPRSGTDAADLRLSGVDIDRRACPDVLTVRLWVDNVGVATAPGGLSVELRADDVVLTAVATTAPLAAGESERLALSVAAPGSGALRLVVDSSGSVSQCGTPAQDSWSVAPGCP